MSGQPTPFSISTADEDGCVRVLVRGELDLATAPRLEDVLNEGIDGGRDVVVDLRALEFMDSSGVRVLVGAHARAGRTGTRLGIVRPAQGSEVDKIIAVSGLDAELTIVADPSELG